MSLAKGTTRFLVEDGQHTVIQPAGQGGGPARGDAQDASAQRDAQRSLVGSRFGDSIRVLRNAMVEEALALEAQASTTHHDLLPWTGAKRWIPPQYRPTSKEVEYCHVTPRICDGKRCVHVLSFVYVKVIANLPVESFWQVV